MRPTPFPATMRLKRRRLIRPLFERGHPDVGTVAAGTVRLLYRLAPFDEVGVQTSVQIGFAVSRRVGKATRRNRIKRVLREVYRVHQHDLVDLFLRRPDTLTMMVLVRSTPDDLEPRLRRDLPDALARLAERLSRQLQGS